MVFLVFTIVGDYFFLEDGMAKAFSGLGVTAGLAADRSSLAGMVAGQQFFETDTNKLFVYNGSSWIQDNDYTTSAMTINATGLITLPYQPRFYALTSSFTVGATGTITRFPFNTTQVNIGSHFNTTNNRFIAPVNGDYFFACGFQKRFAGNLTIYWNKNGTQTRCIYQDLGGDSPHPTSQIIMSVNAGQYVQVDYTLSAGDIYGGSGTEYFTYFLGYLLG